MKDEETLPEDEELENEVTPLDIDMDLDIDEEDEGTLEEEDEDEETEEDEDEETEEEEEEVTYEESSEPEVPIAAAIRPDKPIDIHDVPLHVVIEAGRLKMSLQQLLDLKAGNLLELGITPQTGVNLVVSGKVVGRGELVRVGDALGVRVLEKG